MEEISSICVVNEFEDFATKKKMSLRIYGLWTLGVTRARLDRVHQSTKEGENTRRPLLPSITITWKPIISIHEQFHIGVLWVWLGLNLEV